MVLDSYIFVTGCCVLVRASRPCGLIVAELKWDLLEFAPASCDCTSRNPKPFHKQLLWGNDVRELRARLGGVLF